MKNAIIGCIYLLINNHVYKKVVFKQFKKKLIFKKKYLYINLSTNNINDNGKNIQMLLCKIFNN